MSRVLQLESVGGASGDMLLGALVGLGVSLEKLNEKIKGLQVDPFEIVVKDVVVQGMSGVQTRVMLEEKSVDHHHHGHNHSHDHEHGRHLSTILKLIEQSKLPDSVKLETSAVFKRIGEAEAVIHGIDIEQIHFHEVGAMDSIIDIVGCCLAKHELHLDKVVIRSLPAGHGTIECAHGVYPNPAPATMRILEGFPVEVVDEPFELVTPTGAALVSEWRTGDVPPLGSSAIKSVYSFGHRTLANRPNLLRATLFEVSEKQPAAMCEVLECNLDDMTPELVGVLTQRLFDAGALDVTTQAIMMKKQRPGVLLQLVCETFDRESLLDIIFRESSTFGVRFYPVERAVLSRSFDSVDTKYGLVKMKVGYRNQRCMSASPEIDDCISLADRSDVSVEKVYRAALAAWDRGGGK